MTGLSSSEVDKRIIQGLTNTFKELKGRSYSLIIRENVLTFINLLLAGMTIMLIIFGSFGDAFLYFSIALLNIVVGLVQEINAKRKLDSIATLVSPKVTVIRDGIEQIIDSKNVVQDDLVVVASGDLISVDGELIEGKIEVDESLLTGESDLISKIPNSKVMSGTSVVTGKAYLRAIAVGESSTAVQITLKARQYQQFFTPLQKEVNLTIRILLLIALLLGVTISLSSVFAGGTFATNLRFLAVIIGIIPNSLFAMINLSYALGGLRILKSGALVQKLNAIESLSNVDVLCLDKTGTLTTKNLVLEQILPVNTTIELLNQNLYKFVANINDHNATSKAITTNLGSDYAKDNISELEIIDEIPFNSSYKWSGITYLQTQDSDTQNPASGVSQSLILGAPEVILDRSYDIEIDKKVTEYQKQGLRVLLFASSSEILKSDVGINLPNTIQILGILVFSDQIRENVANTLLKFKQAGVSIKIISGDNPQTVLALARQINLIDNLATGHCLIGSEIDKMSDFELQSITESKTIFGRITPLQKERIIKALIASGHYVAMVGDGVNDVMSLKQANLSIAMESGAQATRNIADILLLKDSFASLPMGLIEGQKIRNGLEDVFKIYLSRISYLVLLIIAVKVASLPFPFTIKQSSLLAGFGTSLPAIGLTFWAHSGIAKRRNLFDSVIHFVLPTCLTLTVFGVGLMAYLINSSNLRVGELLLTQHSSVAPIINHQILREIQTALTLFSILAGLALVVFVAPPNRHLQGDSKSKPDFRIIALVISLAFIFYFGFVISPIHQIWDLSNLDSGKITLVFGWFLAWAVTNYVCLKYELMDKFLGVKLAR